MSISSYTYEPLSDADDEIRLLHLEPGSGDDDIRFTLKTARLSERPEYETISYCWGDPTDTCQVSCDGAALHTTASLYGALKRLRRANSTRVLWADAACIDQGHVQEKNSQVQLMCRIYAQPTRILIWLGEDTSGLEGLHAAPLWSCCRPK